jgi:hypothetical protein
MIVSVSVVLVAPERLLKELPPLVLTCHWTVGAGLPVAAAVNAARHGGSSASEMPVAGPSRPPERGCARRGPRYTPGWTAPPVAPPTRSAARGTSERLGVPRSGAEGPGLGPFSAPLCLMVGRFPVGAVVALSSPRFYGVSASTRKSPSRKHSEVRFSVIMRRNLLLRSLP